MVLLLLMIYIVGVYFTQSVTDHLVTKQNDGENFSKGEESLIYYFGSLSRTLLSLWQAICGGEDWDRMAGPLITEVQVYVGFVFIGYIAFSTLALMNVVTGFFVHNALQRAAQEDEAFLMDMIINLFSFEDKETKGSTVSMEELMTVMSDPAHKREWKAINIKPAEAEYLFNLLDVDNVGAIKFDEFLSGCLRFHGNARSMDMLIMMQERRSTAKMWETAMDILEERLQSIESGLDLVKVRTSSSGPNSGQVSQSLRQEDPFA